MCTTAIVDVSNRNCWCVQPKLIIKPAVIDDATKRNRKYEWPHLQFLPTHVPLSSHPSLSDNKKAVDRWLLTVDSRLQTLRADYDFNTSCSFCQNHVKMLLKWRVDKFFMKMWVKLREELLKTLWSVGQFFMKSWPFLYDEFVTSFWHVQTIFVTSTTKLCDAYIRYKGKLHLRLTEFDSNLPGW